MGRWFRVVLLVVAGQWATQAFGDAALPRPIRIDRYLMFSGFDLWRGGASLHGGGIWSPAGFAASGFALKMVASAGGYRYRSGGFQITGVQAGNSIMPGRLFKVGKLEVAAFAGLDWQTHRLIPRDPGNALQGDNIGLRAGADLWLEPTEGFMTSASLWITTIGKGYWVRGAAGWRLWSLWAGPEIQLQGDDSYRQWRFGLHATGLRFGKFEWSAGTGVMFERGEEPTLYGRLGLVWRR